jgi:DNA polymerase-3 subunit gamma/tau
MSYLVLARKWRPLIFDDVVGQDHITSTLKRAIEKDRVAHAYIFTGTRGVGKTTTARILARALNCDKGPVPEPCGECESCQNIISGSSFDVIEIDGASNSGVDDIRELRENVRYTSMGGKFRVFVIDEVHMLSKSAFNALLKTLEEPPKNVIFIFATTEPQKVPETIHSRCQRYDFRRISTDQIIGHLEKICTKEDISFEKSGLQLIAQRADGSMRDALSLLDQVFSFCKDGINEKEVRSVLGLVEIDVYYNLMEAINDRSPLPALNAVEDILSSGYDLIEFIVGFQEYLRLLLFARLPGVLKDQRLDLSEETMKKQTDQAAQFSEGDLLRMSEVLRKVESDLKWSTFPRFLVETALLKIVYMDSSVSVEQILSSLQSGKTPTSSIPENIDVVKKKSNSIAPVEEIPQSKTVPVETPVSIPQDIDANSFKPAENGNEPVDFLKKWPEFLEILLEDMPTIGSFLSMAHIAATTEDSIDLRFKKEFGFQFSEVTKKNNRVSIDKKLSSFIGRPVTLHITIEKKSSKTRDNTKKVTNDKTHYQPSLEDDMENEPIIKTVIDIFNGDVL